MEEDLGGDIDVEAGGYLGPLNLILDTALQVGVVLVPGDLLDHQRLVLLPLQLHVVEEPFESNIFWICYKVTCIRGLVSLLNIVLGYSRLTLGSYLSLICNSLEYFVSGNWSLEEEHFIFMFLSGTKVKDECVLKV